MTLSETDRHKMIEAVAKAIVSNKLVLFIGAGMSANIELPDWNTLVSDILDAVRNKVVLSPEDLERIEKLRSLKFYSLALEAIAECSEKSKSGYSKREIYGMAKTRMSRIPDTGPEIKFMSKAYEHLVELYDLGARKIVTTNYDDIIERCLENRKFTLLNPKSIKDKKQLIIQHDEYFLKLHGGVEDPDTSLMVLFEEDYRNKYILDDFIPNLLSELFTHNCILFLGCGLSDRYMDIYEKLKTNNAVMHSYAVCKSYELREIAERNAIDRIIIDDFSEYDMILESIVLETRKELHNRCKKVLFSDTLSLENYDYKSAEQFFSRLSYSKVKSCYFFNTQVTFSSWFSPVLQMHLSQQTESYFKHVKTKPKTSFEHNRILFLPSDTRGFFRKLSDTSFVQEVKAMAKIHQFMHCGLYYITTDVLAAIIKSNKDFFTKVSLLKYLGLDSISKLDFSTFSGKDLEEVILRQIDNGYRKTNDLDFAVLEDAATVQIWQANYEKGPYNHNFKYSEIEDTKKAAYTKFSQLVIEYIITNKDELINPQYNGMCLNDFLK